MTQRHDACIGVSEHQDGLGVRMPGKRLRDEMRFSASGGRRNGAPVDRQNVDVFIRHRSPTRKSRRSRRENLPPRSRGQVR
jgi:hypothetical protein